MDPSMSPVSYCGSSVYLQTDVAFEMEGIVEMCTVQSPDIVVTCE